MSQSKREATSYISSVLISLLGRELAVEPSKAIHSQTEFSISFQFQDNSFSQIKATHSIYKAFRFWLFQRIKKELASGFNLSNNSSQLLLMLFRKGLSRSCYLSCKNYPKALQEEVQAECLHRFLDPNKKLSTIEKLAQRAFSEPDEQNYERFFERFLPAFRRSAKNVCIDILRQKYGRSGQREGIFLSLEQKLWDRFACPTQEKESEGDLSLAHQLLKKMNSILQILAQKNKVPPFENPDHKKKFLSCATTHSLKDENIIQQWSKFGSIPMGLKRRKRMRRLIAIVWEEFEQDQVLQCSKQVKKESSLITSESEKNA